jgi:hypothetical protein
MMVSQRTSGTLHYNPLVTRKKEKQDYQNKDSVKTNQNAADIANQNATFYTPG